jgi:translation initiation factor 2 gamma subunit (eIF-2gamma)
VLGIRDAYNSFSEQLVGRTSASPLRLTLVASRTGVNPSLCKADYLLENIIIPADSVPKIKAELELSSISDSTT